MQALRLCALWFFAAAAAYMDFRYRRVPNRLILVASMSGLVLGACGGWSSLGNGLLGFALGLLLLLPAFVLRMVGGGDVKSLAVIGLFTGPHLLWISFLLGTAAGALAALALLGVRIARRRPWGQTPSTIPRKGVAACTLPYAAILTICAVLVTLVT
jgi:Flp pilus assembly protein protease CpaA